MDLEYTITCPHCDAELTVGDVHRTGELRCSECGGEVDLPRTSFSERRVRSSGRSQANREIGRAYRALESIRVVCIALAVISGFLVLRIIGKIRAGEVGGDAKAWLGTILPMVVLVAVVVAAVRLPREGRLWTGICALGASALIAVAGTGPYFLFVFLALGSWAALGTVARVRPLLDKYPDLRIARKMKGQHRRGQ